MPHRLTLYEDVLVPGKSLTFARHTVVYVVSGRAEIDGAAVAADDARYGASVVSARDGARLWRWELASAEAPAAKLSAPLTGFVPEGELLMRCDSVAFPPGGCAYLHTHRGPGIRCLLEGSIRIDMAGTSTHYRPGEAWFEPGPEPVFAQADSHAPTRFIRVMILPRTLLGRPSISYVTPEDRARPKSQRYRVYLDQPIAV